jgi:hypothetical protein
MKILILSPLFPPDTGAPASYTKELADRLGKVANTKLLVYGFLPEKVIGVTTLNVDKRTLLPLRIFRFTASLLRQQSDLILVNNAPSIELPLLLISFIRRTPFVLLLSDPIALAASKHGLYAFIHKAVTKRAKKIILLPPESDYKIAERLPFVEFDAAREARRQTWWDTHLKEITS